MIFNIPAPFQFLIYASPRLCGEKLFDRFAGVYVKMQML